MMYQEVLEGQKLNVLQAGTVVGKGKAPRGIRGNENTGIVIDPTMLGKHILALGAIGSGKSNIIYHMIKGVVLDSLTPDDVVIFFDAKGDYLQEFYRPGDYAKLPFAAVHGGAGECIVSIANEEPFKFYPVLYN
jgi:hypothetical protein